MTIDFEAWQQEAVDFGINSCVHHDAGVTGNDEEPLGEAAAKYYWLYVKRLELPIDLAGQDLVDWQAARDALWPDMTAEEQQLMVDWCLGQEPE